MAEQGPEVRPVLPAGAGVKVHDAVQQARERVGVARGSGWYFYERTLQLIWEQRGPRDWVTMDQNTAPGYGWRLRPPLGMILLLSCSYVLFRLVYSAHDWMPGLGISSTHFIAISQAVIFAAAMITGMLALPVYLPAGGPPPPAAPGHDPLAFQRRIRQRMEQEEPPSAD